MSKNSKRKKLLLKRQQAYEFCENAKKELKKRGIKYNDEHCNIHAEFFISCWLKDGVKCQINGYTKKWISNNNEASGTDFDELYLYLKNTEPKQKLKHTRQETIDALKNLLEKMKTEENSDIIDKTLKDLF